MQPLTVSQLTSLIKQNLEGQFRAVFLQGEVFDCKVHSSGHIYFSLKDGEAQISAVLFRADAVKLRFPIKPGALVVIHGEITVFPPRGHYQLVVRQLSLSGVGELLLRLEELKQKIHARGWFRKEHKKTLPPLPQKIGVVTSPTGSVIRDILHVLHRRFFGFQLVLIPVKVQGEGAAEEIAIAIEQCNRYQLADVLIVGRGGGSLEDLWAFNEEIVASAIFHSQIPVISAVGHETDHTIADYVADVRAPTPSAAAEMVMAEKTQLLDRLAVLQKRVEQQLKHQCKQATLRLQACQRHPIWMRPHILIETRAQRVDAIEQELIYAWGRGLEKRRLYLSKLLSRLHMHDPMRKILQFKEKMRHLNRLLHERMCRKWEKSQEQILHLKELFRAIDPKKLLHTGYSILFAEKENIVISSVNQLQLGQHARLLLSDGEVLVAIERLETS